MFTSNRTIKWIENLADQELSIKAGERVSIDICTTRDEVLSAETATFVRELLFHLEYMVKLFNLRVSQNALQIKVQRPADASDGFLLIRNRMRLCVTRRQAGVVQIHTDKLLESQGLVASKTSVMSSGTIESRFGAFDDVEWIFLGSPVSAEQVARHYVTEFLQMSRGRSDLH
jgi:hypothetical protein